MEVCSISSLLDLFIGEVADLIIWKWNKPFNIENKSEIQWGNLTREETKSDIKLQTYSSIHS